MPDFLGGEKIRGGSVGTEEVIQVKFCPSSRDITLNRIHPTEKRVRKGQVLDQKDAAPRPCKKRGGDCSPRKWHLADGQPFKWPSSTQDPSDEDGGVRAPWGREGWHLPWRRRFLWRRAALRRFMKHAARMLTRTAMAKKQTPPTTPANTGWGRRPGSCVREGYTSRPGQRDRKEDQRTVHPHITSSNPLPLGSHQRWRCWLCCWDH